MTKKEKIVIYIGALVVLILVVVLLFLLLGNDKEEQSETKPTDATLALQAERDSLQLVNDNMMRLENLSQSLDSLPNYGDMGVSQLSPDQQDLMRKYNDARDEIQKLMNQLKKEQADNASNKTKSKQQLEAQQKKISELEGQINQLKGYCKDLLGRLQDLNEKYEQQVAINTRLTEERDALQQTVTSTKTKNEELTSKVVQAQRLVVTGVSLHAYNKKGKTEKNVTKAKQLGVSFTVTANNAAAPGVKDFYVTIKSPEGVFLTGGGAFSAEGTTMQAAGHRQLEYANEELTSAIYWDVNTSLTPGEYTVRVFCNGECLKTSRFTLK